MKEASGELSMTAVAVVAIGAIAVLFTTLILPGLKANIKRNTYCSQAYDCEIDGDSGFSNCKYLDEKGKPQDVRCKVDNDIDVSGKTQ